MSNPTSGVKVPDVGLPVVMATIDGLGLDDHSAGELGMEGLAGFDAEEAVEVANRAWHRRSRSTPGTAYLLLRMVSILNAADNGGARITRFIMAEVVQPDSVLARAKE